ncbi:hypothetical protein J5N97_022092 [Dioscorea zingiberensis]|uniref:Uncharacterized protein n=1 Tax=Dioscorea zingiberensis TaxID=325984 RepID=A0A9D5CAJ9_9LILI|nr:hypothetical protein J5N97_022092 [Dioscorea zingiberensis]
MELAHTSPSSSPEFEFWMVGNNPNPTTITPSQPRILTADELFSDGVLLPLHQLSLDHEQEEQTVPPTISSTKKWKDILNATAGDQEIKKRRIRDTELRIHIWPFMRSRSAGRAGPKAEIIQARRKVSSAPCSRSNSSGGEKEKKIYTNNCTSAKKRASSGPVKPGIAGGIHLNRPGLMWKLRRSHKCQEEEDGHELKEKSDGNNKKVLNFNVKTTCVGYQSGGGSNGSLVKLKAFFSKKLH